MSWLKFKTTELFALATLMLQATWANKLYDNYLRAEAEQRENVNSIQKFLQQIDVKENYKTCVLLGNSIPEYPLEKILQKDLEKLILLLPNIRNTTKCYCWNRTFLVIVRWHDESSQDLLKRLATIFNYKRSSNIVVIKNELERNVSFKYLTKFFVLCKSFKLPNLVLLFKDFTRTHNFYQFQLYPHLSLEKSTHRNGSLTIFPNKMKNIYGTAIRTLPDQVLPKTAAIIDERGQVQVKGYVMKFLALFNQYINGTLQFPFNITIGKPLEYRDIYKLTQRDLLDVPASLASCYLSECSQLMSDTYEVNEWCIMVPTEQPYSYKDYLKQNMPYSVIANVIIGKIIFSILLELSKKVWSLNNNVRYSLGIKELLVNASVAAGMFGSPFKCVSSPSKSMRLIYLLISISGLVHYVLCSAIMQTFLTQPSSHRIKSLADLSAHNLRVVIAEEQYKYLLSYFKRTPRYGTSSMFKVVPHYEEFFQLQTTLNTSYAYPISSPLWFMYNALQTYLNKPIFRITPMCFPSSSVMAFILPPNSLFKEPLNRLIARARDMGLLQHWLKTSYIELVKMKKIYIPKNLAVVKKSNMLQIEDFDFVYAIMRNSFASAFVSFLGELFWYRLWVKKKLIKMK